jgi:hypothetical protein
MADEAETTDGAEASPAEDAGAQASPEGDDASSSETETTETDGGDAAPGDNWRDAIEDEATRKLADRYTSPAALAKALGETQREMSGRLKLPGDDASDEDKAKFRKALGVPEEPSGYEISKPEQMDDATFKSDEMQGALGDFSKVAHEAGASKPVVDAMLGWYWEQQAAGAKAQAKADQDFADSAEADLRKEYGEDYDGNVTFANEFLKNYGSDDLFNFELPNGTLLRSFPPFIRMAAAAGRATSEGQVQMGLLGTEAGTDVKAEYDRLSEEIYTAQQRGETDKAKRLDAERQPLSKRLFGGGDISAAA